MKKAKLAKLGPKCTMSAAHVTTFSKCILLRVEFG